MKRFAVFLFTCATSISLFSQNVGIGTAVPLEKLHVAGNIRSNNLAGTGVRMVGSDANGTLVNIAAGTNGQVLTQTGAGPQFQNNDDWHITGNSGTNPATHFVGTTDAADLVIRTNGTEGMRMTTAQRVGIGTTTPAQKLEVNSGAGDAIYGHSANVGGYLGYETNISFASPAQNVNGAGVYAANPAAGYSSFFCSSTGAASTAAAGCYSDVWMGSYNLVENASATYNPSAAYAELNVTNSGLTGIKSALVGYNDRGTTASASGTSNLTNGVIGYGEAQNEGAAGVMGVAYSNAAIAVGGYFEGNNYAGTNYAYSYVGGTVNTGATIRKIIGTGTVNEIIPTANHGRITLTCPESPEYWYQDYGSVQMNNGRAHVSLDPILADIIVVDAQNPIRAFCTPVNMPNFNGITVMNMTPTGFDLVELNGGTHSGTLDYQLVCKPKTNYGEGRFSQAPGPAWLTPSAEPTQAKARNQPVSGNVFHWPADYVQYGYDPDALTPVGQRIPAGPNAGKIKTADGRYLEYMPMDRKVIYGQ